MAEQIEIPILTPGANDAARNIKQVGDAAAGTGAKLDFAAVSLKAFNDASAKAARADTSSVNALKAHAKATSLLDDAYRVLNGDATKTTRLFADQQQKIASAGDEAAKAAGGFTSLAGSPGGGGLLAVGAAAALILAPVVTVAGVGLGGLALAAAGAGKNSKALRADLLPLKGDLASFQKQLQPVLLQDFAKAAGAAQIGLHDLEPAAAGAGRALGGVFSSLGTELASPEFTSFFQFIGREAGPDLQLLGNNFVQLLKILPPVIQGLHGVSVEAVNDVSGIFKLIGAVEQLVGEQHKLQTEASDSTGWLGRLGHAVGNAFDQIDPAAPLLHKVSQELGKWGAEGQNAATGTRAFLGPTVDLVHPLGIVAGGLTSEAQALADVQHKAYLAASPVTGLANAVKSLNTQLANSVGPNATFNQDLINVAGSARAAEKALDGTHDKIGLNTAAQRAAFGAQQTYISNLVTLAQDAGTSRDKQDEATAAIKRALPQLENVKGGTQQYWQEVKTLVGWLGREEQFRKLRTLISVNAQGTWHIAPNSELPGGTAGGPFAAAGGAYVRQGTTPTADNVLARVSKGELIVPTHMVNSGAVDHLRGRIPGFAGGGVVPSYSGSPSGLASWTHHNFDATVTGLTTSIANSFASGIRAAASAASPGFGVAPSGPLQNYARKLLAAYGWSSQWPQFNDIVMRESGWNVYATNPSSGAYGIPQALPGWKMASAGADWRTNGFTQLRWMAGYLKSRWGSPAAADANEIAAHWYDNGGMLKPGLTLAYNGTNRPEMVVPNRGGAVQPVVIEFAPGSEGVLVTALLEVLRKQVRIRGGNVQATLGKV